MELSALSVVFIVLINSVNARLGYKHPNTAFDTELYERVLDPELCDQQVQYLRSDLMLNLKFIDAGIRIPRGLLNGNAVDLGYYPQCLGIEELSEELEIKGKYCMVKVPLSQPNFTLPGIGGNAGFLMNEEVARIYGDNHALQMTIDAMNGVYSNRSALPEQILSMELRLAVCIPRPCTVQQAKASGLFDLTEYGFEFEEDFCRLPNDKPWRAAEYVAVGIFSLIGLLTVLSTLYDVNYTFIEKRDSKQASALYRSFSLYTNGRRLTTFAPDPNSLHCLDGIRALAMLWVIVGHTFITENFMYNGIDAIQWLILVSDFPSRLKASDNGLYIRDSYTRGPDPNSLHCLDGVRALDMLWFIVGHTFITENFMYNGIDAIQWMRSVRGIWVTVAPYTVDTFFMMTGLLLVYTTVGKLTGEKLLKNLHLFYLNRLLRLFPLLAFTVLLQASFLNSLLDGPYWVAVANLVHSCREYWWSTLLNIQNYATPNTMCVPHSWYIAIDVQLHILSPIVLFWVLSENRRTAWIAMTAALAVLFPTTTYYNAYHQFQGHSFLPTGGPANYLPNYYVNTFTRSAPFFVGMIFGYTMSIWKGRKPKIQPGIVLLLWACTFTIFGLISYKVYGVMQSSWDQPILDVITNSYGRSVWAAAIGWIIFACVHGYGGPINWFLSLDMWKLPARLSYAMYLLHYPLQFTINSTAIAPVYFTVAGFLFKFLAHGLFTFLFSFVAVLVVDAPCSTLIKLALGGGAKKERHPAVTPDNVAAIRSGVVDDIRKGTLDTKNS